MRFSDLDLSKKYSYADYLTWTFEEVVELIKGKVFKMSPGANMYHQRVASKIHATIYNYLKGGSCEVFFAPFDVILPSPPDRLDASDIDTVVQPDVFVVCDRDKITVKGCIGAPDWIIEILSKSTSKKDLNEKFDLYENAGVKEYWVIHPFEETLIIFYLNEDGKFEGNLLPYTIEDIVQVKIFPDFELKLTNIFEGVE